MLRSRAVLLWVVLLAVLASCTNHGDARRSEPAPEFIAAGPLAISVASKIVAADATLASMVAPTKDGWERSTDGATSTGWRATAKKQFDQLGARLSETANATFEVGLSRYERFTLKVTREGASASPIELHDGRGAYAQVYPSTDVVVVANAFRYEELLVLRDGSAPTAFAWRVEVPRGLRGPRRDSLGWVFDDAKGSEVLRIPTAYSIDAGGVRRPVDMDWRDGRLLMRPDLKGASWPVVVDPAVETAVWEDRSTPDARYEHGLSYDSTRGRIVLFGGLGIAGKLRDTWEWNGTNWAKLATTGPSARIGHRLAHDSARGRTVLFGGQSGGPHLGDTWEWDGATWTQKATTGPSPRFHHALAYDSVRGRVVLFGGSDGGFLGDTWEWDGATWMQKATTGPSPRSGHAMAYDSARDRIVLFGGNNGPQLGDTWEWDGATWTQRMTTGPSPRFYHDLAYDSVRGRIALFGGTIGSNYLGDTWEWDGTNWTQKVTIGPGGRYLHGLAYDSARGQTVLFAGNGNDGRFGDTWEWNGTTWTQRSAPPSERYPAATYDSTRARTLLFGGYGTYYLGDTWEWDGTTWIRKATTGPSPRRNHAVAHDSARGRTVLFGGVDGALVGDTWEWDGVNWMQKADTGPSQRDYHAMVYDSARARIVLFGGEDGGPSFGDTWEWDGTQWEQKATTGPAPRRGHALAYDSARGRTVLFGGGASGLFGDTWEWDGTSWTQKATTGPTPRIMHAMTYDNARRQSILFGGETGSGYAGDTWEWDGVIWRQRATTGPAARRELGLSFDASRGRAVLFGGYGLSLLGDTWEYHTHGGACANDSACDTGNCVDGVCCEVTACPGTCQGCNGTTPGVCSAVMNAQDPDTCTDANSCNDAGICLLANAQSCTAGAQCASNNCVDNTCCATSICGTCESCAVGGNLGTCSYILKGNQDPDSCAAAGQACNGAGSCKKVNAQSCSAGSECISTLCVDSVCCATVCSTCQSCALTPGACANIASGVQDPDSCSVTGQVCDGSGGCKKINGQSCSVGPECLGGNCVDNTCCASASCGTCQTCATGSCVNIGSGTQDPDSCNAARYSLQRLRGVQEDPRAGMLVRARVLERLLQGRPLLQSGLHSNMPDLRVHSGSLHDSHQRRRLRHLLRYELL